MASPCSPTVEAAVLTVVDALLVRLKEQEEVVEDSREFINGLLRLDNRQPYFGPRVIRTKEAPRG